MQHPTSKWAVQLKTVDSPSISLPYRWIHRAHGLLEVTGSFEEVRHAYPTALIEVNKWFLAFGTSQNCEFQAEELSIIPLKESSNWSLNDPIDLTVQGQSGPILWTLLPPLFANPEREVFNWGLRVRPDSIGGYRIKAQNGPEDGVCHSGEYRFIITADPPFYPTVEEWSGAARSSFLHLREMEATNLPLHGEDVTIAILDTGIHYNHPALHSNMKRNLKEVLNQLDDDKNGLVDDLYGWDFVYNDNSPYDDEGHGSAQAGFAASSILGVAPQSRILPVKVVNAFGHSDTATVVAGIRYAVDQQARIINLSLDVTSQALQNSQLLQNAFEYAHQNGALIVVAAGNRNPGENLDKKNLSYFAMPNVIVVGARRDDELTTYSNWGTHTVHAAVPGGDAGHLFESAFRENARDRMLTGSAGTSVATSLMSGSIALIAKQYSNPQIIEWIQSAGYQTKALAKKTRAQRAFTAQALLNAAQRSTK